MGLYPVLLPHCSHSQPASQSVSQSVSQVVSQSVSQSINQSTSQSVNQSINQSVNQSVSQPVSQSMSQASHSGHFTLLHWCYGPRVGPLVPTCRPYKLTIYTQCLLQVTSNLAGGRISVCSANRHSSLPPTEVYLPHSGHWGGTSHGNQQEPININYHLFALGLVTSWVHDLGPRGRGRTSLRPPVSRILRAPGCLYLIDCRRMLMRPDQYPELTWGNFAAHPTDREEHLRRESGIKDRCFLHLSSLSRA